MSNKQTAMNYGIWWGAVASAYNCFRGLLIKGDQNLPKEFIDRIERVSNELLLIGKAMDEYSSKILERDNE